MSPKLPTAVGDRFEHADDQEFQDIRRKSLRWATDNATALKTAEPWSPPEFTNRVASNWPMFAISADGCQPDCGSAQLLRPFQD
jgi:hypothetical protein